MMPNKLVNLLCANRVLKFPNLINLSAILSEKVSIRVGNIICVGSILTVDMEIGNFLYREF